MKKLTAWILSLTLLLNHCPAAFAEGTEGQENSTVSVKVTASSGSCLPGKEIAIPVSVEGNPGFTNLAIALEYDARKLELKAIRTHDGNEVSLCGTMYNSSNIQWKKSDDSTCGFLTAASYRAVTDDGILFTAVFQTKASFTGTAQITPKVLKMRSNAGDFKKFEAFVPEVVSGAVRAILAGDVTGDGMVEYDDVMEAYKAMGKTFEDPEKMQVADLNNNSIIDEGDVNAIYNIYTGGNET